MKKILSAILLMVMLFAYTACGNNEEEQPKEELIKAGEVNFLTETWVCTELTFQSLKEYNNGKQFEVVMDAVFTNRTTGTTLTIPAFWDGGNIFKVRFAPTEKGIWDFKTICESDDSLHDFSGTVGANPYSGELDIYKHGFVTVEAGKKYFVYADGTPFFYLGDTHWNMFGEEFDSAGPYAGDLQTDSHFKYIVDKRVEQGYTVYQSQPGDTPYSVESGFNEKDIEGFKEADKYFQYIAEKGLVHANSQFFFTSTMTRILGRKTEYIENLSRYWVARFGAYPVMWTLAQEMDNDFLVENNNNNDWDYTNNPWVQVAEYINKYDAYNHPLTGHQENAKRTTINGMAAGYDPTVASDNNGVSLFATKEASEKAGHNWWGAQWQPSLDGKLQLGDFGVAKEYWMSEKPAVMYESRYDRLWTMEFGARAQGWIAYLNGMYGYGYGAQDIWAYDNDFLKDTSWSDGVETVTVEDHQMRWSESIELPSGYQVGYMRQFFEKLEWHKLVPTFNSETYFKPNKLETNLYACATDENNVYVVYFYSKHMRTGTIQRLDANATYTATWYNPRTNEYTKIEEFEGEYYEVPLRPDREDWVLLVTKN